MSAASAHPAHGHVSVWQAHIDDVWPDRARMSEARAWLDAAERERYARYRFDADRAMFLLGRMMARTLVGRALGCGPMGWGWREGARGRPEVDSHTGIAFNIAHSAGLVLCALSRDGEVGVDVEDRERHTLDMRLVERYGSPAEIADVISQGPLGSDLRRDRFLQFWTLKEAYLKARGLGISVVLSDLSFSIDASAVRVAFLDSLDGSDPNWAFAIRRLTDRHLAAVAAPRNAPGSPTFSFEPFPLALLA